VNGLNDALNIASGYSHTCVIIGTGGCQCWGQNGFGQLGTGTTLNQNRPAVVIGLESIRLTSITTGRGHSCATTSSYDVYCWGYNGYGQLGIGSRASQLRATVVPNIKATSVTAGEFHTCATTLQKNVKCWGGMDTLPPERTAYSGQLGTGNKIGSEKHNNHKKLCKHDHVDSFCRFGAVACNYLCHLETSGAFQICIPRIRVLKHIHLFAHLFNTLKHKNHFVITDFIASTPSCPSIASSLCKTLSNNDVCTASAAVLQPLASFTIPPVSSRKLRRV
jgi:hypothetical protein